MPAFTDATGADPALVDQALPIGEPQSDDDDPDEFLLVDDDSSPAASASSEHALDSEHPAGASDADDDFIDFEKYVGGTEQPDNPDWRHMQADYTRKTQRIAEERKRLQAAEDLTAMLSALEIDPNEFAEQLRHMQQNPQQSPPGFAPSPASWPAPDPWAAPPAAMPPDPYGPAAPAGADPYESVYARDEWVQKLRGAAANAATEGEEIALGYQLEARQREIRGALERRQYEQERARQSAWQQEQARSRSFDDALAALRADDPVYAPLLRDPATAQSIREFARAHGVSSAETAANALYGPRLRAIERALGERKGRNTRQKAQGASLLAGRSATTVQTDTRIEAAKKGGSLADVWAAAKKAGVKLKG